MKKPGCEAACHPRDRRGFCMTKESRAKGLGRGEVEALELVSSAGAWAPDGFKPLSGLQDIPVRLERRAESFASPRDEA